jgi:GNAT superfamily N-acetyltransferase
MNREITLEQLQNIENNEIEFFALHRSEKVDHPEATLLASPYPGITIWNFAGAIQSKESVLEKLVDEVEAHFEAYEQRPCFRLNQLTQPDSLENLLVKRGYENKTSMASMTLDSNSELLNIPGAINTRRLKSEAEIALFSRIQKDGFGGSLGAEWDAWFHETNLRTSQRDDHRFYLAEFEGEPAGVSLALYTAGGVCGIYAVATIEAYRKRGIARAMFAHVIADAREAGHDLVTLCTALDGPAERAFERLGFERFLVTKYLVK